ncbi:MAG: alanine racemase C-terminal domain-containing protein, partial [Minisyncoccia bacterium]
VAMGYGDGLKRSLSNVGHMVIKGIRASIIGMISMDSCAIDIGDVLKALGDEAVQVGHMATVVGRDGTEEISVGMLASQAQTVTWEILTSMAERLPRKVV